jgi:hypothetical protein
MGIAERNHRRHASGWEPPELAERHRKDHAAKVARAPLFDPKLVSAAPQGRKPRNSIEPHGGPWSVPDADQEPASSPEGTWCRLACSPEIHEGSTPSALLSAATAVSGAGLAFAGAATAPQTSGSACA